MLEPVFFFRIKMFAEPIGGETRHLLQRARFFKEMRGVWNDFQLLLAADLRESCFIQ